VAVLLFQKFVKGGCQNCKTTANTFGFKEKCLSLDDWTAGKVVFFINHTGDSFDE
jgi:hypothetical protein